MQFQSGEWADVPSVQVGRAQPQQVPRKLSVVIPFIQSEVELVTNLLNRSIELSGQIPRAAFLVPFKGLKVDDIVKLAQKAFSDVGVISDAEGIVSDWQDGQPMRSAAGPNSLFRQAAWFFYLQKRFAAWLWMEPDCTPITSRWLFELEHEYFEMDRPFLGVKMKIGDGREYMNGVGIYPWNAIQFAPLLVQSAMWQQHPEFEVGFDVAGGADVLNKAHMTRKIQLELRKRDDFAIRPETVLLHGRDNDLRTNGTAGEPQAACVALETRSQDNLSEDREVAKPKTDGETSASSTGLTPIDFVGSNPTPPQNTLSGGVALNEIERTPERAPSTQKTSSQTKRDDSEYGAVSKQIRSHIEELVKLWGDSPSRKVLIVKELRNAKLVPKHFR